MAAGPPSCLLGNMFSYQCFSALPVGGRGVQVNADYSRVLVGKASTTHPDSPEATPERPHCRGARSSSSPLGPGFSERVSQAMRLFSSSRLWALCSQAILQTSIRQGSLNCIPDPNNPLLKSPSRGATLPRGHVHTPKL